MTFVILFLGRFFFSATTSDPSPLRRAPLGSRNGRKRSKRAKKEGQVTVYISGYEAVLPDFEKEFPDIKVVAVTDAR